LSGCQFPSLCPYGVAFLNVENDRTVLNVENDRTVNHHGEEAVVKLRPKAVS
jgi:hypothetical protein